MDRPIHVVGGGIAGLVAAVTAAEAGAPVVLHEASTRLGGRALGGAPRRGVNLGPHVVFTDGALVRWLRSRRIRVPLRVARTTKARILDDRGLHRPLVPALRLAGTALRRPAPAGEPFREWADDTFGTATGDLLCRLSGLFTFHHDPGALSAAFVWERYRRTFLSPDRVRWIGGGWSTLVAALEERALDLGVVVERGDRISAATMPDAPTVAAVPLAGASRLLERRLRWPGARTALLDVVTNRSAPWPLLVADVRSDLATCCMVERETAVEPGLVDGDAAELFQAHLGVAPQIGAAEAVARIEDAFDRALGEWRDVTLWRRGHVVVDATGAVDPPGTTWRDRPAVDQGDDRFVAGDAAAAPGMLCEVAVNSAVRAAHLALAARRRRLFAPGWPTAEFTPERRLAVLAAVLPGASVTSTTDRHGLPVELAPVDETGPGYRIERRRGTLQATAVTDEPGGPKRTTLIAPSRRRVGELWWGLLSGRGPSRGSRPARPQVLRLPHRR